ncbi:MAG: orotidine-5'-phosphate decarboxylase [Candidatus Absconditicoccaceae bacterium]
MKKGFRKMLAERQQKLGSVLCVGLDPLPEKMPARFNKKNRRVSINVANWMIWVVDQTAEFASMYKPQRAYWEAMIGGEEALRKVIHHIHKNYPDIPVFLDCKRGDIDRTQARYRDAHFEIDEVDGMNFSPYMGEDTMSALVNKEHMGRALVGLCYTSNPKAREVQDVQLQTRDIRGFTYWEFMAATILRWSQELGVTENAGLVMAAAYENPKGSGKIYSKHLKRCREIVGDLLWFLIPGVGTQGGFVQQTIKDAFVGYGSIAINSSSGIIFAENPGTEAKKLHEEMAEIILDMAA